MSESGNIVFRDVSLLRCPESRQSLELLDEDQAESLNARIQAGEVVTDDGRTVERALDAALIREDEQYIYPVRDGVPNLLLADRIALDSE